MAIAITGPLVLTSPAHQSAIMGRGEKGPRRTLTLPIFEKASQGMRTVPYITANSVRGRLRRLAAERVFKAFEARGERISRDAFLVLSRGSVGRADIRIHSNANAIVEGAKHVFAGLFGGGPAMLHSRYAVAPLLPLIEWTVDLLPPRLQGLVLPESTYVQQRTQPDGTHKQVVNLTTVMMWTARDPLLDGQGAGVVEDYAGTLSDWLAAMESESAAHKAASVQKKEPKKAALEDEDGEPAAVPEELGAKSSLQNFGEIRVLPPGLPLQWNVTTKASASLAQEGLILLAVADFIALNSVGGGAARGMGRFNASELAVVIEGDTAVPLLDKTTGTLNLAEPEIRIRVEAAEAALNAITAASIEAAFGLESEQNPKKKGPKGKDAAKTADTGAEADK